MLAGVIPPTSAILASGLSTARIARVAAGGMVSAGKNLSMAALARDAAKIPLG